MNFENKPALYSNVDQPQAKAHGVIQLDNFD